MDGRTTLTLVVKLYRINIGYIVDDFGEDQSGGGDQHERQVHHSHPSHHHYPLSPPPPLQSIYLSHPRELRSGRSDCTHKWASHQEHHQERIPASAC
jgi:hypothetical protein